RPHCRRDRLNFRQSWLISGLNPTDFRARSLSMPDDAVFVGGGGAEYADPRQLLLRYGNRHGLITGATGTGKTVTLQILAEGFSAAGVPVFVQDVKGDVS